jgi:DNA-binding MarR family transcriptional regulator
MSNRLDCLLHLTTLQAQLHKAVDRRLSLHGISFSEFYILFYLGSSETQTMRRIDLAERVGLSASGITRALNPMEKIGLVHKEANPRDARVSLVKLSPAGERILGESVPSMMSAADDLLTKLGEAEVATLLAILQKI